MMILAAVAALVAQGSGPGPVTPKVLADAREAFNESLLDYPSARFRDARGNAFVLCGFVNAKNRMGAYTGWERFAWVAGSDDPRMLIDDSEGRHDILLDAFCGEDGLRMKGTDYSERLTSQQ